MGAQGHSQSTPTTGPAVAPPAVATGGRDRRQDRVGNAGVQAQLPAVATGSCTPEEAHPPTPVAALGALTYYAARAGDFSARYCGAKSPTYYFGYGKKYVDRFTLSTGPRLTPEGQAWLARARVNLQTAIEGRLAADPAAFDQLEKNDAALTSFCYGTHADAYWNAGLGDLGLFDLARIGLTPDMRDLLAYDGLLQVADIGSRLLGTWGEAGLDYVAGEGATEDLVSAAYEGYAVVGAGIDEAFGEGTAASLEASARDLGAEAGELAHDAYDVAAEAVGEGVAGVDGVMGEGWTEQTADGAREAAGEGVDWAEGQYESGKAWAQETWDDLF